MISNTKRDEIVKTMNSVRSIINIDETNDELLMRSKKAAAQSYIVIKEPLLWDEYAKLVLHAENIDSLILEEVYSRRYADPLAIGHVLGYVGASELNDMYIEGKTGIEKLHNEILYGILGNKKIEVNSRMRYVRHLETIEPIDGADIKLSIDLDLQNYVYKLLSEHNSAACVVLDLHNGHILSAVSVPGIDINVMSRRMSNAEWSKIANDKYLPMNNRIFRSLYSPGSVFKIFLAYAAQDLHVMPPTEQVNCTGCTTLGKDKFHCWKRTGHGLVDLRKAMACSCDVYFHEVARRLGIDNIEKYAKKFGFGERVCLDVPSESVGLIPSREWKRKKYNNDWKEYETILVGTGQGYVLSNIMQIATATARLCLMDSNFYPTFLFDNEHRKQNEDLNKAAVHLVKQSMFDVCNSRKGTAVGSCKTDYVIAGKTGSTQVRRLRAGEQGISQKLLDWKDRDHALFVGFAPYASPRYVVAVIVEHGGGGASVAAPIARKILDKIILFNQDD